MTDQDQAEISISDATRRYGVSRTTLLYAIDHQKIRARLVPVGRAKHRYLMSLPDLERWLADEHLPRPRRGGDMDLLFLDTETTGLDPLRHEIVDIWAQRRRAGSLELVGEAGGLVLPAYPERSDEEALRINGFSPDLWESLGAEPFETVWDRVSRISQNRNGLALVGSNPRFDMGFLEAALGGERFRMWRPASIIDTVDLAQPLKARGMIRSRSLEALCEHLDIHYEVPAHTARGDVLATVAVYERLMGMWRAA